MKKPFEKSKRDKESAKEGSKADKKADAAKKKGCK